MLKNRSWQMNERKALIWFLVIAFGFSWLCIGLSHAWRLPGPIGMGITVNIFWTFAASWGPGLGALFATRLVMLKSLKSLSLGHLGPRRFYLVAWLLPLAITILSGLLTVALGVGELTSPFPLFVDVIADFLGGRSIAPLTEVAVLLFLRLFVTTPMLMLLALGEELGWQGFLLPRLLPLGQWPAILISAVVAGLWHLPGTLLTSFSRDPIYLLRPDFSQAALDVFLKVVSITLSAIIYSWFYLRTRSPWASTLAHGSHNATLDLFFIFMSHADSSIGTVWAIIITRWIVTAAVIGVLVITKQLPVSTTSQRQVQGRGRTGRHPASR